MDSQKIEAKLQRYAGQERQRLGLNESPTHWHDASLKSAEAFEQDKHTLLFGGLSNAHDQLMLATLEGHGFSAHALPIPNHQALQRGKEFGNRGQCNPTYFTVGNLVSYLQTLQQQGLSTAQIVRDYAFVTASTCGPCRFGMYVTEYRKALRDAGFEGFRILSFQTGKNVANEPVSFSINKRLGLALLRALVVADALNALGYRMRPYEINVGETDTALAEAMALIAMALRQQQRLSPVLKQAKNRLDQVALNLFQVKPKVSIIGEFWAMTTEGEGNYRLQRFLEKEGAECDVQPITAWFLYLLWAARSSHDEATRAGLHRPWQAYLHQRKLSLVETLLRTYFQRIAKQLGLVDYPLSDMDDLARVSAAYYPVQLRGGEGHMEVGKLIHSFRDKKHHLVLSIKPFACMPSSGVSDGIQPLVMAHHPEANFLAVETSGDGAVNVYSRVQMALFRARKSAEVEYEQLVKQCGFDEARAKQSLSHLRYFPHHVAGTAANGVLAADRHTVGRNN